MSEYPLLISAGLIPPTLSWDKTMTRRILRSQPPTGAPVIVSPWEPGVTAYEPGEFGIYREGKPPGQWGLEKVIKCPYGTRGDILWVREEWIANPAYNHIAPRDILDMLKEIRSAVQIEYRAGRYDPLPEDPNHGPWGSTENRWRRSIHMPRWASRIDLYVMNTRVERLQAISHEDAIAEGAPRCPELNNYGTGSIYRDWFAEKWDSINKKRPGCLWKDNPLVWVVEFSVEKVRESWEIEEAIEERLRG